jgi:spermidine/putrescine-binding protein
MNWFQKNFKTIIYIAFLVPILTVAFVSISHVTKWYGLSNPFSWAIYLSVGIEIAALSALAAISAQMGKKVYFPFGIVTLVQFIGNIFFAYQYIDINSQSFKDWVDLVDPIVSFLGVGDIAGHKRFLALFSGGMLPLISLSFLHMLVKFEEEDKKKLPIESTNIDIDELSIQAGKMEAAIDNKKYTPTEEDLKKLEEELIKLNQQKFGSLESEMVPHEEINEPEKKVLNYSKRND